MKHRDLNLTLLKLHLRSKDLVINSLKQGSSAKLYWLHPLTIAIWFRVVNVIGMLQNNISITFIQQLESNRYTMPPKRNPLKLNKLQLRTLALVQVLAGDERACELDEATGEVTIKHLPHAHGDHVHIGAFSISARDASGLENPAVWTALSRKGFVRVGLADAITLTPMGLSYDTGLSEQLVQESDH